MAERIFNLQETRGSFQVKGNVNGVEKEKFYTSKTTKTGKDFRAVNFGCEYDDKKSMYLSLNGMPQANVYFSKRNQETGKTETKTVPWANRNKFKEDGWRMIGVNLGLVKTTDANGKEVNDKKTMTPYDACDYIHENLEDDASIFVRGNLEFSSYLDKEGNTQRSIKYVPNQISLCKDVDFSEYDGVNNKPTNDFTQHIVFMGIEKEKENDKDTGRFIVSAKIITYSDIVDTEFYITDNKLAGLFKKNLKAYHAITVHGHIEVVHNIEEVEEEDSWGEKNAMNRTNGSTKVELVITGATPSTIDKTTYDEDSVSNAMQKIRAARTAEQNFSGKENVSTTSDDDWGDSDWGDDDDDENPF
jgi:hypothetical protein